MFRRSLLALSLLAIPSVLFAQQRQGPPGGGQGMMGMRSPIAIVLEKKAELKLTDEQIEKLDEMEKALTARNAPLMAEMRSMRESGTMDREKMREVSGKLRANNGEAQGMLKDVLNAEQLEMATRAIEEAAPRRRGGGL